MVESYKNMYEKKKMIICRNVKNAKMLAGFGLVSDYTSPALFATSCAVGMCPIQRALSASCILFIWVSRFVCLVQSEMLQ